MTKSLKFYFSLLGKGIGAGLILSFAGAASVLSSAMISNPSLALLTKSLVFSVGLVLILVGGFSLFTGGVASLLTVKNINPFSYGLGLISIWFGNLFGSIIASFFVFIGTTGKFSEMFIEIANTKCSSPLKVAALGIACNFLIAHAVMTSFRQDCGELYKIATAIGCVFLFVICGFEHSIANMFYLPYAILCGADLSIGDIFLKNILPVSAGNLIGGWLLILFWMDKIKEKRR